MDIEARLRACLEGFRGDIDRMRGWYASGFHHGVFCGPGTGTGDAIDDLDACCAQHDIGYGRVDLSAETAWDSPQDYILSRHADRELAMCAQTATIRPDAVGAHSDPETYRQNLIMLFTLRADIGDALFAVQQTVDGLLDRIRQLGEYLPHLASNQLEPAVKEWVDTEIAALREAGVADHEMGLA